STPIHLPVARLILHTPEDGRGGTFGWNPPTNGSSRAPRPISPTSAPSLRNNEPCPPARSTAAPCPASPGRTADARSAELGELDARRAAALGRGGRARARRCLRARGHRGSLRPTRVVRGGVVAGGRAVHRVPARDRT